MILMLSNVCSGERFLFEHTVDSLLHLASCGAWEGGLDRMRGFVPVSSAASVSVHVHVPNF